MIEMLGSRKSIFAGAIKEGPEPIPFHIASCLKSSSTLQQGIVSGY